MKRIIFFFIIGTGSLSYGQQTWKDATVDDPVPLAPAEYRRPEGYDPVPFRYKYSLKEMQEKFSAQTIELAHREYARMQDVIAKGKWKATAESIDQHPTPEWFSDIKFGMLVDWGLWSIAGYATPMEREAMYPDWYEYRMVNDDRPYKWNHISIIPYHNKNWGADIERGDFIPLFKAERYDAKKLVELAAESGMKYLVPFCKHFSGWCIWPSSYTHMDVGDRLGKDLMRPLADHCNKKGLKFGFYYGTQEWEYPIIGANDELLCRTWFRGNTTIGTYEEKELSSSSTATKRVSIKDWENIIPGKIPVRDFLTEYSLPQAIEFIDMYDPDLIFYDGEWTDPIETLGSYEMAAYLYNHAEGRKEVAVNDRMGQENHKGVRHKRGDIYTTEMGYTGGVINKRPWMDHAWEENRSISQSFGFNWLDNESNVLSSKGLVDMLINVVSAGGNLLLIVNLDGQGGLPKMQEDRLKEIGKWIKVNGEGIYYTRSYSVNAENNVRFTRSKDNKTVFAIALEWPGKQLTMKSVEPAKGSKIYMLGYKKPLEWTYKDGATTIILPDKLQDEANRPCHYAYTFKIQK
ncbi:MAG: alpha-L-fucosidase [Bacteroidales bacterium]|jgi:alpha-L-fucosidase|nr:alpha-L-fucosidase [Bacteroidales bacterium]